MGKIFYGKHADKDRAMEIADANAKAYKKGVCYTPSSRIPNACRLDKASGKWICQANAHHQRGSCGARELTSDPGGGTEWSVKFPPIEFNKSMGAVDVPATGDDATAPEAYEDASPEDYSEAAGD